MSTQGTTRRTTIADIARMHADGVRIAALTAYDVLTARILDAAGIPILLVGDSLGMVVLGYDSTVPVTIEDMIHHGRAVVRGDSLVPAISAASILAKTARDAEMRRLHERFPQYRFDRHKGYPTPEHLALLGRHGASEVHRRSFMPVRDLFEGRA